MKGSSPLYVGLSLGKAMAEKRNVFVSHIHEDDAGLGDFQRLLADNGMEVRNYSITSDKENNARSPDYIKSGILGPRIDACSTMVVYITPETKNSEWVDWEIERAFKKGKTIVGVWERGEKGCEVPDALKRYYDAIVGWNSDNIIDAINGKYRGTSDADGEPVRERTPIKPHPCG